VGVPEGPAVGVSVGANVATVGADVGTDVGEAVGNPGVSVGATVGAAVGSAVGVAVGLDVTAVGANVGADVDDVGAAVGVSVGLDVAIDGANVGADVGDVGAAVGDSVGLDVATDGTNVGTSVGDAVGELGVSVGATVGAAAGRDRFGTWCMVARGTVSSLGNVRSLSKGKGKVVSGGISCRIGIHTLEFESTYHKCGRQRRSINKDACTKKQRCCAGHAKIDRSQGSTGRSLSCATPLTKRSSIHRGGWTKLVVMR